MKTIYDAIHGFIKVDPLEAAWLKSPWFLRLQSIHQLGAAYRIFPGAKHTRFEHSLGVMHLSTLIFDHLNETHPFLDSATAPFYRQLLRIAALSHDIGHLPFSHTAEAIVLEGECHEAWTLKILNSHDVKKLLEPLINQGQLLGVNALELIQKIAVGEIKYRRYVEDKPFSSKETLLSTIVTGDFFGADRMDYLLRDAKASGLSYGIFDHEQLIMSLLIATDPITHEMSLMIDEKGVQACESLLVARYFMYQRLYMNPKVQALSYPMSLLVKKVVEDHEGLKSVENYLSLSDVEVLNFVRSKTQPDTRIEKFKKAYLGSSDGFEAMPVSDEQLLLLKEHFDGQEGILFLQKQDRSSFFSPSFKVKTFTGIYPFNQLAKLVIPKVSENFVLFESTLMANVLAVLHEVSCS